jgi:hypothetical protein
MRTFNNNVHKSNLAIIGPIPTPGNEKVGLFKKLNLGHARMLSSKLAPSYEVNADAGV